MVGALYSLCGISKLAILRDNMIWHGYTMGIIQIRFEHQGAKRSLSSGLREKKLSNCFLNGKGRRTRKTQKDQTGLQICKPCPYGQGKLSTWYRKQVERNHIMLLPNHHHSSVLSHSTLLAMMTLNKINRQYPSTTTQSQTQSRHHPNILIIIHHS